MTVNIQINQVKDATETSAPLHPIRERGTRLPKYFQLPDMSSPLAYLADIYQIRCSFIFQFLHQSFDTLAGVKSYMFIFVITTFRQVNCIRFNDVKPVFFRYHFQQVCSRIYKHSRAHDYKYISRFDSLHCLFPNMEFYLFTEIDDIGTHQ